MKKLISILLAVVIIATVFVGCGKAKQKETETASPMADVQAMAEYAEMLEAEGNAEAAAQVWSMIPDAADEAAREELRNEAESSNEMQAFENMGEANDIINSIKGGK